MKINHFKSFLSFTTILLVFSCSNKAQKSGHIGADISKLTTDFDQVIIERFTSENEEMIYFYDTIAAANGKFDYHFSVDEPKNTSFHLFKDNKRIGMLTFRIKVYKTEIFLANPSFGNENIKIYVDSVYEIKEFNGIKSFKVEFEGSEEAEMGVKSFYYKMLTAPNIKKHPSSFALLFDLYDKRDAYKIQELENLSSLFSDELKKSKTFQNLNTYISTQKKLSKNGLKENFNWVDTLGNSYTFEQVRQGKDKVLFVFWASWCRPCREEIPYLKKFLEQYKDKVALVSLSIDNDYNRWKQAVETEKMTWINLSGLPKNKTGIKTNYNITAVPTMILVDKNGKIIKQVLNDLPTIEKLLQ